MIQLGRLQNSRARVCEPLECRRLFSLPFGKEAGKPVSSYTDTENVVDNPQQILIAPDGTRYVGGSSVVTKFATDGSTGFAQSPQIEVSGNFVQMALDGNNGLYILNQTSDQTHLYRYSSGGVLDVNFGNNGDDLVSSDAAFTAAAMIRTSDGRFVIAGTEANSSGNGADLKVLGLSANGSPDSNFASNGSLELALGTTTTSLPIELDGVAGMSLLANGRILIGGGTFSYASPPNGISGVADGTGQFVLLRMTGDGQLDTAYGAGGLSRADYAITESRYNLNSLKRSLPFAFSARADGSAVIAGSAIVLASFSSLGIVEYDERLYSDSLNNVDSITGLTALPDGRVVLVGNAAYGTELPGSSSASDRIALTPISVDGTPQASVLSDNVFDGISPYDYQNDNGSYGTDIVTLAPDGRLLVASSVGIEVNDFTLTEFSAGNINDRPGGTFANGTINSAVVALDSEVYLAYYDTDARHLMFSHRVADGLWTQPIPVDSHRGAGEYLSIQLDSEGNPWIAYFDASSHSLKVADSSDDGRRFELKTVDASADVGEYVSFVFLSNNQPAFAYYDRTAQDLRFATTNSRHGWAITTVDSVGDVGQSLIMTLNSALRPVVAYVDNTQGRVKFAQQNSKGAWGISSVAQTPGGATSLSIEYASDDLPAVSFYVLQTGVLEDAVYRPKAKKFAVHPVATRIGQTSLQAPDLYTRQPRNDPALLAYDRPHNRVLLINDPLGSVTKHTLINNAGGDFTIARSALSDYEQSTRAPVAAYIESGNLVVRDLTTLMSGESVSSST